MKLVKRITVTEQYAAPDTSDADREEEDEDLESEADDEVDEDEAPPRRK